MIAFLATVSFSYSYYSNAIEGSGKIATEVRSEKDFHAISLDRNVQATLSKGPFKVQVRADDNFLRKIKTEVRKGTLRVFWEGGLQSEHPIELLVQAPNIDRISLSGASGLKGTDLNPERLAIKVQGGASLELKQLNVKDLDIDASGAGRLAFHQIATSNLKLDASGGSNLTFEQLTSKHLDLDASGAAEIHLSGSSGRSSIESSGGSTVDAAQLKTPFVQLDASGASHTHITRASAVEGELQGGATAHVARNASVDLERSRASTLIQE